MGNTLQPENRIAHYRIVGPLGAGGMGEVYLAHDEKLERDVALKVLPVEFTQSEIRIKRFILEAKSASSLSHPHIVTIYEIGHDVVRTVDEKATHEDTAGAGERVHYIAMELVKGKTIKDLIHQEKSSLKALLGYLAQAAEGLSKAHDAGIVHRDLKPGNMMVTDDGYAKVLDFGLAKLTERTPTDDEMTSAPTEGGDLTGRGAVVGTAAYMSPEQVKGKGVDHRSDIFSFGCILYEAATRTRPFNAETEIDTMHKIVHDKPPALEELNPAVPAELRRVIRRCMAKNPDQRLQSIKDLAIELREIVDEFDTLSVSATSGSAVSVPALALRRSPLATISMVAAAVIGVVGISFGIWSMFGKSETGQSAPRPFQSVRMTSLMSGSDVLDAKLSPDGRYLAYIKGPSGAWSLWVRQVATGSDVQILVSQPVPIRGVSFSPDGNYLYYLGRDPETPNYSALFEVPSLGGAPRKRGFDIDTAVSFSPDGTRFAFIRGVPPEKDVLVIREMETGQETVLVTTQLPDALAQIEPAWSPDGSRIVAVVTSAENGFSTRLVAFDAANGSEEPVTEPTSRFIGSIAWLSDGSGLAATTPAIFGGSSQVFVFSYPMADRYQVTNDLDSYGSVSVSGGNAAIAALRTSRASSLWTVPVEGGEARQITSRSSTDFIMSVRALESGMISFSAQKDRHVHLWTMNPDGSGRSQITSLAGSSFSSSVLPDGRGMVFSHFAEADSIGHVWRVDLDGG
ncbi:MAG: protein kinase, partial [Acidobacteria bacterium]|nr:protein kinase [Acidobacteriota bacterium]